MRKGPPVLMLQVGEAPAPVKPVLGDYPLWYERAWGGPLAIHDARNGHKTPDPRGFAGILITGSAASLTRPEPWMEDVADYARRAHDAGTPVLGICFGHQLLGWAFGGRVVENPNGWEVGSCEVTLGDEGRKDRLFEGLPSRVIVNFSHQDVVDPESLDGTPIRVLAGNGVCSTQAIAVGEHTRGVQFHPEFDGPITRAYIEARRQILARLDPDALIQRTGDTPHGVAVLRNFRRHFVESGRPRASESA